MSSVHRYVGDPRVSLADLPPFAKGVPLEKWQRAVGVYSTGTVSAWIAANTGQVKKESVMEKKNVR